MGGFCRMVGWSDGCLVGSMENFLQFDWSTGFMQVILLVSLWAESVLVYTAWSTV
jgi:hypothetical protein